MRKPHFYQKFCGNPRVRDREKCPAFGKAMTKMTFKTAYPADVTVQLDSGATCSAMSMGNLQDILQSGKVKLDPPNGCVKLYDGRVVTPLGQYTFDFKIGGGKLNSITFDVLENAPWPIIDGNTCI